AASCARAGVAATGSPSPSVIGPRVSSRSEAIPSEVRYRAISSRVAGPGAGEGWTEGAGAGAASAAWTAGVVAATEAAGWPRPAMDLSPRTAAAAAAPIARLREITGKAGASDGGGRAREPAGRAD